MDPRRVEVSGINHGSNPSDHPSLTVDVCYGCHMGWNKKTTEMSIFYRFDFCFVAVGGISEIKKQLQKNIDRKAPKRWYVRDKDVNFDDQSLLHIAL